MNKVILEFTLNNHKHTYFRRFNIYKEPITTTNKINAKLIKENEIPKIIEAIIKIHGKNAIKDIKTIKGGEE